MSQPLIKVKAFTRGERLLAIALLSALLLGCGSASADVPAGFVDASAYGYNTTDATAALQAAIDTGQNVYVPDMGTPWIVTPINLTHSNQEIQFANGVVVQAKAGAFTGTSDSLFTAKNLTNVKMIGYGATLQMRKSDYVQPPYTPGQGRMGIRVYAVNGFDIEGLTIKDTGGDGIYVGADQNSSLAPNTYSQNVQIKNVRLDNNYRNGISLVSAQDVTIDNAVILNTSGQQPQAGIDFEPNYGSQVLKNITVKNSVINANGMQGILFATHNMSDPSQLHATIANVTLDGNHASGLQMVEALSGVTIKNSLFVANQGDGVDGDESSSIILRLEGTPKNSIDYSAFWANTSDAIDGWAQFGPGSLENVQPLFYSTDPNSPYFMELDPSVSSQIAHGADDGGYMGARPVYVVPEPATGAMMLIGGLLMLRRKRK